jgi:excisionase family DNA binding protein
MALEQHYSVKTLAKKMDMNPSTIYDKVHKGELKGRKLGKSIRISESAVNEWLKSGDQNNDKLDVDDLLNKKSVDVNRLLNKK